MVTRRIPLAKLKATADHAFLTFAILMKIVTQSGPIPWHFESPSSRLLESIITAIRLTSQLNSMAIAPFQNRSKKTVSACASAMTPSTVIARITLRGRILEASMSTGLFWNRWILVKYSRISFRVRVCHILQETAIQALRRSPQKSPRSRTLATRIRPVFRELARAAWRTASSWGRCRRQRSTRTCVSPLILACTMSILAASRATGKARRNWSSHNVCYLPQPLKKKATSCPRRAWCTSRQRGRWRATWSTRSTTTAKSTETCPLRTLWGQIRFRRRKSK